MASKTTRLITVKSELNLQTDSGNTHRNTIRNKSICETNLVCGSVHSNTGTSNSAPNLKTYIPDI